LTTLNLAKVELIKSKDAKRPFVCSMASVKALYFNQHFLQRIFAIFDFDVTCRKFKERYQKLLLYGSIAA